MAVAHCKNIHKFKKSLKKAIHIWCMGKEGKQMINFANTTHFCRVCKKIKVII